MIPATARKRYLDDRIVYCANCEANRLLASTCRGPACSACQSINWMHLPQAQHATVAVRAPAKAVAAFFGRVMQLSDSRLRPIADKVVELSGARLKPVAG